MGDKQKRTPTDAKAKARTSSTAARKLGSKTARTGYARRAQSAADKNASQSQPKGQ